MSRNIGKTLCLMILKPMAVLMKQKESSAAVVKEITSNLLRET